MIERKTVQTGLLAIAAIGLLLGRGDADDQPAKEKTPEAADASSEDYIRFVKKGRGEGVLETSIVSMKSADGVVVDLISAVHVGDAAYYKILDDRFASYDSLLYELISAEGDRPVKGDQRGGSPLTLVQRAMKDALALEFQLDKIDYSRKNFVHADLDPETFFRLQKERGESILSLMFKAMRAEMANQRKKGPNARQFGLPQILVALLSDDSSRTMKFFLAQQMSEMEALLSGFEDTPDGKGSVIVSARNEKALEVLAKRLAKGEKKIGIFYGGGHMADLEKRLLSTFESGKHKFKRSGLEWVPAWVIEKVKKTKKASDQGAAPDTDTVPTPGDVERSAGEKTEEEKPVRKVRL